MHKIDLHTHSIGSPDGGISLEQYVRAIENGNLDFIAITDHDNIDVARALHTSLGDRLIIGEEITTLAGEIIGLFLKDVVRPGQSAMAAVKAIKAQGGLVYIPHPFETVRSGMNDSDLRLIAEHVDIVEVHNGRALFQNRGPQAVTWAALHHKARASASDAHGWKGLGHSYSLIEEEPTAKNLVELLTHGRLVTQRPPLRSLLYPKYHRFRNKLSRRK